MRIKNTNEKQTSEVLNDLIFLFFFYCVWKRQQKWWNINIKVVWKISNLSHKTTAGWVFLINQHDPFCVFLVISFTISTQNTLYLILI